MADRLRLMRQLYHRYDWCEYFQFLHRVQWDNLMGRWPMIHTVGTKYVSLVDQNTNHGLFVDRREHAVRRSNGFLTHDPTVGGFQDREYMTVLFRPRPFNRYYSSSVCSIRRTACLSTPNVI